MSIDTQVRPPALEPERKVFGITIPQRSGGGGGGAPLVVGAQPRANLLPPEVILKRKQLKTRRALRFGVLLVAAAVVAGCIGSFGFAAAAQLQLSVADSARQQLVTKQSTYSEVTQLTDTIDLIQAGQQVGGSTEIAWRDYLVALQKTLPAGVTLKTVAIESATPMSSYQQSNAPLQGARVAGLTFTATSAVLPSIPDWLRAMAKLDGFVDAIPGSVKLENGVYTTEVLMHINTKAFSLRFDPATVAAAAAEAAANAKANTSQSPRDGSTPSPSATTDSEGN